MRNVYKGQGWLVPVIFLSAFFDVQFVVDFFMGEGFYKDNRWVKVFSIIAVAFVVGVIGYLLNRRDRLVTLDDTTDEPIKSPAHTLLFLPIEVWAVIVPFVFLSIDYFMVDQEDKTLAYLQSPQVNDIYSVDFSKIFKNEDPVYKYGTMVVVGVDLNLINIQSSTHAYDGKSGVRKDIYNGKAKEMFYYTKEVTPFSVQALLGFYKRGAIFAVSRDSRLQPSQQ